MQIALELFGLPALAAAIVALATVLLAGKHLPTGIVERYAYAGAAGSGFLVGYVVLNWRPELAPTRHEEWLPYLVIGAIFVGAVSLAEGVTRIERWLLQLALALAAAWLLTPTWQSLQPARPTWIAILTAYFFLLTALLDPLPERLNSKMTPVLLTIVALAVTMLVAVFLSLSYAQLGALASAALLGGCGALFFAEHSRMVRVAAPLLAISMGGVAFIACVYPEEPLYAMLAAPAAPLVLWLFALGPLSRLRGVWAGVAQTAGIAAALAIVGLAVSLLGEGN